MDSGNMGDPDHTGHTDHDITDHTGHTDQAITQVASEESSKPKNELWAQTPKASSRTGEASPTVAAQQNLRDALRAEGTNNIGYRNPRESRQFPREAQRSRNTVPSSPPASLRFCLIQNFAPSAAEQAFDHQYL